MENTLTNFADYPEILNAIDIQNILRISKGKTYEIMNSDCFPTIYINKRMIVLKTEFIDWLKDSERKIKQLAAYKIYKDKGGYY